MARRTKTAGAIFGSILAILGLVYGFGSWLYPDANPMGVRDGKFAAPVPAPPEVDDGGDDDVDEGDGRFSPNGNDSPTTISFQNVRSRPCLIQKVEYNFTEKFDTPNRQVLAGGALTLPVTFHSNHYVRPGLFRMVFNKPLQAEGMDWVNLQIAIVYPRLVGTSFLGSVKVFYNDTESIEIKNVEIDVLARDPDTSEW